MEEEQEEKRKLKRKAVTTTSVGSSWWQCVYKCEPGSIPSGDLVLTPHWLMRRTPGSDWIMDDVRSVAKKPGVGDSDRQGLEGKGPVHGANCSEHKLCIGWGSSI